MVVVSADNIGQDAYEDVSLKEEEDASSISGTGEEHSPIPWVVGNPFSASNDAMKHRSDGDDDDESIMIALDLRVGDEGGCVSTVWCSIGKYETIYLLACVLCVSNSPHPQPRRSYFSSLF